MTTVDPRFFPQPNRLPESPRDIPIADMILREFLARFWTWASVESRDIRVALNAVAVKPVIAGIYVSADPGGLAGKLGISNVFPALGGGAAPVLGTIGGTGPAVAAQAGWLKLYNGVTAIYIPYWV